MQQRQVVEHTSPLWRLLAVALFFAGVFFFGWAARIFDLVDQFATFLVVTAFFAALFWAKKRPDKLRRRFGPFGRVALAVQESADDIRASMYSRSVYYGVLFGMGYALLVVVAKSVVVAVATSLYAWQIVAAVGCLTAAAVVAPQLLSAAARRMSVPDEDPYLEEPREVAGGGASRGKVYETLPEAENRPEDEEVAESGNAGIGYYDEEGNELTAEEFEELFARGREEDE